MRLDITLCLGLTFGLAYSHSSEPIKPEQFNKLHSIIKPNSDEEKFMQIPWMIDLWEARKKPLLRIDLSCSGRWMATHLAASETTESWAVSSLLQMRKSLKL